MPEIWYTRCCELDLQRLDPEDLPDIREELDDVNSLLFWPSEEEALIYLGEGAITPQETRLVPPSPDTPQIDSDP